MRIRAFGTIATLLLTLTGVVVPTGVAVAAPSKDHTTKQPSANAKKESTKKPAASKNAEHASRKRASTARVEKTKPAMVARVNPKHVKPTIVHSETTVTFPPHEAEPREEVARQDKGDKAEKSDKIEKIEKNVKDIFELPALPASIPAKLEQREKALPGAHADVPLHREDIPKPKFKPSCMRPTVTFVRGTEEDSFALTRCDGSTAPMAVEKLSMMARSGAAKPAEPLAELIKKAKGTLLAPGVKKLDPRLVEQLQLVIDHFVKQGSKAKIQLVSGFRPTATGSYHATGHALDFKIDGVSNEALVGFCKTLSDVGCGYYPNSTFVHMDVREAGTGHVSWIDASGPGERPHYVASWPPPRGTETKATTPVDDPNKKPKLLEAAFAAVAKLDHTSDESPAKIAGREVAKALSFMDEIAPRDKAAEAPAAALMVPLDDESKIEN